MGLLFFLMPHFALAQSGQGSITGSITDAQGAAVPGAKVTVTATDTQAFTTTESNNAGLYNAIALNPGDYTVTVERSGFDQTTVSHVTVSAAHQSTVGVQLHVGKESVQVTVTSQDSLLTKDDSNVTTTVDHKIVENLPYPERSSLEAALLVPGVNGDPLQPGGISTENPNAYLSAVTPGSSISIGGGAPGSSSIYVDGSDVTQASYPRAGINLSGRVVGETSVIVTGLSAKYGRTSSGVIVQNTAPGTSDYHGALTWRHTDPYFNAFPLGGTAANDVHENFYGGYLGGPVWIPKVYNGTKHTFFFVAFEPARLRVTNSFRGTFFTPDELAGNFNNSLPLLNQTILKNQGAAAALAAPRVGGIYYQSPVNAQGFPNGPQYKSSSQYQQISGPVADCGAAFAQGNPTATSCPNDLAPQLAQNPLAKYVFSLFPTPSNPGPYVKFDRPDGLWASDGTNGVYERGATNTDNRYSIRIDQDFGERDKLWGRFTSEPLTNFRFFALAADNPASPYPSDSAYSKDIAIGYTHVLSNNIVNNIHYSFLRVLQNRIAPPAALSQDYAAKYGLVPSVSGVGFPSLGTFNSTPINYAFGAGIVISNPPGIQRDQNFIGGDDLSWVKGKHLLQFGVDLRWIQSNQYNLSGTNGGKYQFFQTQTNNGSSGGLALATFVLGTISSFSNTPVAVPGYYRWKYDAGYFQDDWRATPALTLNIGVRYEVETPRAEASDNQGFIRLNQSGTLNGMPASAAFCFANGCGGAKHLFPTNWWGIEPRIGFSYAPTVRTTIRGSYGMIRLPLTGYENTPDPDFNLGSLAVNSVSGGENPANVTNYISNPVAGPLTSAYTALNGARGPLYSVSGVPIAYVNQSSAVPYTQTYSMTVQYQVTQKTLLQATYQGLKGTHLIGSFTVPINTPNIGVIMNAIQSKIPLGNTQLNPYMITSNGLPNGPVLSETLLQALNPYQNFFNQNMTELYPRHGSSSYNGLYLSIDQRFGKGLALLANYVWQKSLDNVPETNNGTGGGFGVPPQQNPFDLSKEYSVSGFDQPSRLKYGFTYLLPLGQDGYFGNHGRLLNAILGDIQLSGIGSVSSGFPNFVTLGSSGNFYSVVPKGVNGCAPSGTTAYCINSALPAGYSLRPNIVPGVPLINPAWKKNPFNGTAPGGITPFLNINAFSVPGDPGDPVRGIAPTPAFGNAPRTLAGARSPRETMFDLRVSKGLTFHDHYQFNLNATLNNAFNHPVYFGANGATSDLATTYPNQTTNNTPPPGTITHAQVANFGTLNQGQTAGMSRIIRIGAEFTF